MSLTLSLNRNKKEIISERLKLKNECVSMFVKNPDLIFSVKMLKSLYPTFKKMHDNLRFFEPHHLIFGNKAFYSSRTETLHALVTSLKNCEFDKIDPNIKTQIPANVFIYAVLDKYPNRVYTSEEICKELESRNILINSLTIQRALESVSRIELPYMGHSNIYGKKQGLLKKQILLNKKGIETRLIIKHDNLPIYLVKGAKIYNDN